MSSIDPALRRQIEREYLAKILSQGGPTVEGLSKDYSKRLGFKDILFTVLVLSCILGVLYTLMTGGFCFDS